jgi:hypothetical protein
MSYISGRVTVDTVKAIAAEVRKRAEKKSNNAAFSGGWHDGGAGRDLEMLDMWLMGWDKILPPQYEQIKQELELSVNEEYLEYLRLKSKYDR